MKLHLLIACAALGIVGCATQRGGVNSPYETEYGTGYSGSDLGYTPAAPFPDTTHSIYPVRRQPSPNGNDAGSVRPMIDPSRQYDWGYDQYDRDYPPRRVAPREIVP